MFEVQLNQAQNKMTSHALPELILFQQFRSPS